MADTTATYDGTAPSARNELASFELEANALRTRVEDIRSMINAGDPGAADGKDAGQVPVQSTSKLGHLKPAFDRDFAPLIKHAETLIAFVRSHCKDLAAGFATIKLPEANELDAHHQQALNKIRNGLASLKFSASVEPLQPQRATLPIDFVHRNKQLRPVMPEVSVTPSTCVGLNRIVFAMTDPHNMLARACENFGSAVSRYHAFHADASQHLSAQQEGLLREIRNRHEVNLAEMQSARSRFGSSEVTHADHYVHIVGLSAVHMGSAIAHLGIAAIDLTAMCLSHGQRRSALDLLVRVCDLLIEQFAVQHAAVTVLSLNRSATARAMAARGLGWIVHLLGHLSHDVMLYLRMIQWEFQRFFEKQQDTKRKLEKLDLERKRLETKAKQVEAAQEDNKADRELRSELHKQDINLSSAALYGHHPTPHDIPLAVRAPTPIYADALRDLPKDRGASLESYLASLDIHIGQRTAKPAWDPTVHEPAALRPTSHPGLGTAATSTFTAATTPTIGR